MTRIFSFDQPPDTTSEESMRLLGGKGHNLTVMRNELGLPVPPGFTITTETGHAYLEHGWPEGLDEELREHMAMLEEKTGRRFGGPGEPLLVSVRSGAPVSMPGMMDTILNLGLNEETTAGLAQACGDVDFATGSRKRLVDMYRDVVAADDVPTDPWDQLESAIEAVFRSWNSPRALSYRAHEKISDDICTAVTVQTMVFGNLDDVSATGVLFTRNPATGEPSLYGDVMFRAQGEDVVAGTHSPEPISVLDQRLPEVGDRLREYANLLERHYRDVCDIEFTIERGELWLLQVRIGKRSPQAALRIAVDMADDEDFPLSPAEAVERVAQHLADPPMTTNGVGEEAEMIATGLAASPGIGSGQIATTPEAAVFMADAGSPVILVRAETSPDDVQGMARVAGILTSRGGLASHAAVVARGWAIPAVVGAGAITVSGRGVTVGDRHFEEGDPMTIDGHTGRVYAGKIEIESRPAPEAQRLLAWADEYDIQISGREQQEMGDETTVGGQAEEGPVDPENAVRALHIKGFATAENLAPAVGSTEEATAAALAGLVEDGLVKEVGSMYQLTDEGKEMGVSLMHRDRERWGVEEAVRALDSFLSLDTRMKEIVTSWQMRQIDGEQVINDHTDDEYDRAVLETFAELGADAGAWLEPLCDGVARFGRYLDRLEGAASRVERGDHDFIASPRVDSYHTVWFELHEDLIQLAGKTREEEAEAGRA